MKFWHVLTAATLLGAPVAAAAQYEPPANPPDPVAQRDEMIALYDELCLRAFPDDEAVARTADGHDARALSASEVRRFLHDDPGIGWEVRGRTGPFHVTIEQAPPYHTCAVRTMTASGFADLGPYQALVGRYEQGRGFERITPMEQDVGDVHVVGGGERRIGPGDSSESLLVMLSRAADAHRARGHTAIEVRFAHQYHGEAGSAKPGD